MMLEQDTSVGKRQRGLKRPAAAARAPRTGAGSADASLVPLLRTAKHLKRSLLPVDPSPAFRAGLEDELIQVARRLARARLVAPTLIVEADGPNAKGWAWVGLGVGIGAALTAVLLLSRRRARH